MSYYDFYNNKYSEKEIRDYIEKYPKRLNWMFWYYISEYQELSEDFIREFQDKLIWHIISERQILSEPFIREFQDRVDWYHMAYKQNLSEEFLIEFIERFEMYWIRYNEHIPEEVKERISNMKRLIEV